MATSTKQQDLAPEPKPAASRADKKARTKDKAASIFARPAPRTMALGAILLCFAASGLLRFGEVWQRGDIETLFASSPLSTGDPEATADIETATIDPARAGDVGETSPSVKNARDMDEALAAMEAAIAAGDYATASTLEDGAAPGPDAVAYPATGREPQTTPPLPPIGTTKAGQAADLLAALKKRESELDAYAEKLAERNEALTLAAERLETRIQELETSKEQFAVLVATVDQAASRDVSHLIKMYQKMKPKEAGPLFDAMDPSFAAGFLARMKPDAASAIMAKMNTAAAYAVSLQLAGRNVRKTPGVGQRESGPPSAATP